jgi:hypothetical protein
MPATTKPEVAGGQFKYAFIRDPSDCAASLWSMEFQDLYARRAFHKQQLDTVLELFGAPTFQPELALPRVCMHCCTLDAPSRRRLTLAIRFVLVRRTASQQVLKAVRGHPFCARQMALPGAFSPLRLIIRIDFENNSRDLSPIGSFALRVQQTQVSNEVLPHKPFTFSSWAARRCC